MLSTTLEVPRLARRLCRDLIGTKQGDHTDDAVLLAVSELATSAVPYGIGPIVLTIEEDPGALVIRASVGTDLDQPLPAFGPAWSSGRHGWDSTYSGTTF